MQAVIFKLIGTLLDSDYSEMFLHSEGDDTIIMLNNHSIITRLILPLCESSARNFMAANEWAMAKLVFAENPARLSQIVLEGENDETITIDLGKALGDDLDAKGKVSIYEKLCQYIIKDVNLVLTTV